MNRVAIILNHELEKGEAANASAILMGQMAINYPSIFADKCLVDKSGYTHSGIKYNTVILKSNYSKLLKFCEDLLKKDLLKQTNAIVFTNVGKTLSNKYDEYEEAIKTNTLNNLIPVAIVIAGEECMIRELTKKFSLY